MKHLPIHRDQICAVSYGYSVLWWLQKYSPCIRELYCDVRLLWKIERESAVLNFFICVELIGNVDLLLSTTVTSTTSNFSFKLREKLTSTTQALTEEDKKANFPRTNKECPKCQRPEMTFSQAQLRSADEGTTIFYFCLGCGHRWARTGKARSI